MKAILVSIPGGADQLTMATTDEPIPKSDELLVRVGATALNRADLLQREGLYPPPAGASSILGLEMSGIVDMVGGECRRFKPGDRVFALLPGGGYAEYCVVPEAMAMLIPERISLEEAAAIPEAYFTAYQALVWLGKIEPGERVLVHAGASGVGMAAIQLARQVGATVFATAGTDGKCEACVDAGAAGAHNYRDGPFDRPFREAMGGHGCDLIIDVVGAPYWEQNAGLLAPDGRWVVLAMMGGTTIEQIDLMRLFIKRTQVIFSNLRYRSERYKVALTREFEERILPLFAKRRLAPKIDRVFPLTEIGEAHRYLEANRNIGKVVVRISRPKT